MKHHTQLLVAGTVAATLMMAQATAQAPAQLMSAPVAITTPQESAGLVARLKALDNQQALSTDYSFRISSQHPGVVGQKITRAQHTYKGLRVLGSESVVVTTAAGEIVSVSITDRRPGLAPSAVTPGGAASAVAVTPPDITPTISSDDAIRLAVQAIAPRGTHRWAP